MSKAKRRPDPTWEDIEYLEAVKALGGDALIRLSRMMTYGVTEPRLIVTRFVLKAPKTPSDEFFVIVNAVQAREPLVGFHGGPDVTNTISGAVNRIGNGSMKWREDEYSNEFPVGGGTEEE